MSNTSLPLVVGKYFSQLAAHENGSPLCTVEQIKNTPKVTLKSGKEVLLFTFGHNYGPGLQPGFRSLTEMECVELCELIPDLPAEFVFIINDEGLYFCYNDDITALVALNPLDILTKVMKSDNPILQSNLPFWHHYICYLPQIKLEQ